MELQTCLRGFTQIPSPGLRNTFSEEKKDVKREGDKESVSPESLGQFENKLSSAITY